MRTGLIAVTSLGLASILLSVPSPASAQEEWVIYVNPCFDGKGNVPGGGCSVQPGANNAREYQTDLAAMPGVLPEFSHGQAVFDQVVECVSQVYAPFNVRVVDTEPPPTTNYHMAIIAGTPQDVGLPAGVGGIGSVFCNNPLTNRISFNFDIWGADVDMICQVIAQESAHTFGLGHAFHCSDPMTYLTIAGMRCGRTFFRDRNFECGEFTAGSPQCSCSGPAQNSHRALLGALGANPDPNSVPGPTVTLQGLTQDQVVQNGFRVTATAEDIRGVDRVEFWVNGTERFTEMGNGLGTVKNPWVWVTPTDLADGYIDLEVKAYNDLEVETISAVTLLKGAPCETEATCSAGQFCEDGRCKFPIATGEQGDVCSAGTDCISGLCPLEGDSGFCSKNCDPNSLLDECGQGFECLTAGAQGYCWPESSGGCGCAAGSDGKAPWGGLLLVVGVALVLRRRRRRK